MAQFIIDLAAREESWQEFLEYKVEKQHLGKDEASFICAFLEEKQYLECVKMWEQDRFPSAFPKKSMISKEGSDKKRVVYKFPEKESIFLKFLAFHATTFDDYFQENCYAFRRSIGVKEATRRIRKLLKDGDKYCLKTDIHNYFNSIPIELMVEKLSFLRERDLFFYKLCKRLLLEEKVYVGKELIADTHGAMAGMPLSPFFANVYLADVDAFFAKEGVPYFRYSDDILIFADTMEELLLLKERLYQRIADHGLTINEKKEQFFSKGESPEFLGFSFANGEIDLSANTIRKIKGKMKRKAEALRRWQRKKGLDSTKAAVGFIRAMNYKFYGKDGEDDFSWNRWFFPNLTTDNSLKIIDEYMQQCIRYVVTGKNSRGNYRIRYQELKKWGYRSLVNEYWRGKTNASKQSQAEPL